MNYTVGNTPNYNAPVVDFASFFDNNKPKQLQPQGAPQGQGLPQQSAPQDGTFMDKLKQFLNGQHGQQMVGPQVAGQPMQLPSAPNSTPMMDNQGRGLY